MRPLIESYLPKYAHVILSHSGIKTGEATDRPVLEMPGESDPQLTGQQPPTALMQQDSPARKALRAAGTVGLGLAGFGGGLGMGMVGSELLDRAYPKLQLQRHLEIPLISGALGSAATLAYNSYKNKEIEDLRRALQNQRNTTSGAVPGQLQVHPAPART